jgi:hypothetical protein
MVDGKVLSEAEALFQYLYKKDLTIEKCDLIIGFGHFDMKIPRKCAQLYEQGMGRKVLFTGGRGAGSADLIKPEAVEFKHEVLSNCKAVPADDIIIEDQSTNTGENIVFSQKILCSLNPNFTFERGIDKVIAVASPYRQRRVYLCFKKAYPHLLILNCPPETDFQQELKLFKDKNEDLVNHLVGEIERLILYPNKGLSFNSSQASSKLSSVTNMDTW